MSPITRCWVLERCLLDSSMIIAASWAGSELMEASAIAEAIVLMLSRRLQLELNDPELSLSSYCAAI